MRKTLFSLGAAALALLGCHGTMGLGNNVERIGRATYAISCGRAADCYRDASSTCPYGYDVRGADSRTTGAVANTSHVGKQSYTSVTTLNQTDLIVQCRNGVFCTEQSKCRPMGLRCVRSKRYPGKAVCADR